MNSAPVPILISSPYRIPSKEKLELLTCSLVEDTKTRVDDVVLFGDGPAVIKVEIELTVTVLMIVTCADDMGPGEESMIGMAGPLEKVNSSLEEEGKLSGKRGLRTRLTASDLVGHILQLLYVSFVKKN